MRRSILIAVAALFLIPAFPPALAQTKNTFSSSATLASTQDQASGPAAQPVSRPAPPKEKPPIGAITVGYFYLATQSAHPVPSSGTPRVSTGSGRSM